MPVAIEGTIPLRSGKEAAIQAIETRKRQIEADRAGSKLSPGNRIPPQVADQVDELKLLDNSAERRQVADTQARRLRG